MFIKYKFIGIYTLTGSVESEPCWDLNKDPELSSSDFYYPLSKTSETCGEFGQDIDLSTSIDSYNYI